MGKKTKLIKAIILSFLCFLLILAGCEKNVSQTTVKKISKERFYTNMEAFAKVYGYVRYFHPSDEAANLDWVHFAVYGVSQVKNAQNDEELKTILNQLFTPIAPTMMIYDKGEKIKYPHYKTSNQVIAWQHYGPPGNNASAYMSNRVTATLNNGNYSLDYQKLFSEFPKVNETIYEPISKNLVCSIPLVLYKDQNGTLGSTPRSRKSYKELTNKLSKIDANSSKDENVRYAGVIVTWNILNHFYPYFHVTNSDWANQLIPGLKDTSDDKNQNDYIASLLKLMEKTKDGHASFSFDGNQRDGIRLPFVIDKVENQFVVTTSSNESPIKQGDIVLSINGEDPNELVTKLSSEIPGSPQWKTYRALDLIGDFNEATVKVKRGENVLELKATGSTSPLDEFNRAEPFKEIAKGEFYINLTKDVQSIFEKNIGVLSNAKGMIFDLRGYPFSFELMQDVVAHLTEKPVKGPIGRVMETIYPDQKKVTYDELRDTIPPKTPTFKGKVVFLTYAGAYSEPEYFLGYIKDNHLAQIVGQPTAGVDGNIQQYSIPGGLTGTMTGMEILNADRSQTHMIGIKPDVLVNRTLTGVKQGEDEYLKAALSVINK